MQCMVTSMSTCSANSKVQFALLKVVILYILIYYRVLEQTKITRLQFGVEYSRYSSYSAQPYRRIEMKPVLDRPCHSVNTKQQLNCGTSLDMFVIISFSVVWTGVLREGNQTCVNVYDVIEMCAPAAPPIMLRIRTRSLNPNAKPLTLTLFLTVTGTKFLKENKTGQK